MIMKGKYTENTAKQIARYKDTYNISWTSIGQTFGIDRRTAKKWYNRYKQATETLAPLIKSNNGRFLNDKFKPLERTGDVLVTSDWHIPLHDSEIVNKLFDVAISNNIKGLIINGDFLHLDTFGHFLPHQAEATFEVERADASEIMSAALDIFDWVDFTLGNHDFRIVKFLEHKLSFEYCMRWVLNDVKDLDRVRISNLDYMQYRTDKRTYRICHQKNFSKVPLAVPRQLSMKYGTSVICGHSHHLAQGVALDGFNHIFEGGGLFDKNKTEYIQKTTTHHEWVPGFIMFKDNKPTLFSPVFGNL